MGKRTVKFTEKSTGKVLELQVGALGHEVFSVTRSVNDMNAAVRWCNNHGLGDKYECDAYSIEITSV